MRRFLLMVGIWMASVWVIAGLSTLIPTSPGSPIRSANPLDRWDAAFYQGQAEGTEVERKNVVTPLYSWLVGGVMTLTGSSFGLASAVVSMLLILAALITLRYVLQLTAAKTPNWTVVLLIASPISFSLLAPYPVSLLLLLSSLSWLGFARRQPLLGFIPALIAPLAHPTGLALTVAALGFVLWSRSGRAIIAALVLAGLGSFFAISSGLLEGFLTARIGYTTFTGVSFWTQGAWWLTHHASPAIGWLMLATLVYTGVGIGLMLKKFWKIPTWPIWSALGLLAAGIISGLWIGIPRYLLPSPAIPLAFSSQRLWLRTAAVVSGFVLQGLWIWGYVSWNAFI